jgi:hypothetical protein
LSRGTAQRAFHNLPKIPGLPTNPMVSDLQNG